MRNVFSIGDKVRVHRRYFSVYEDRVGKIVEIEKGKKETFYNVEFEGGSLGNGRFRDSSLIKIYKEFEIGDKVAAAKDLYGMETIVIGVVVSKLKDANDVYNVEHDNYSASYHASQLTLIDKENDLEKATKKYKELHKRMLALQEEEETLRNRLRTIVTDTNDLHVSINEVQNEILKLSLK